MTKDEYDTFLDEVILDLRKAAISGKVDKLSDVVALLNTSMDNHRVAAVCTELKIGTKAEFAAEMTRAKQREKLGIAPANATELVAAYAKMVDLKMTYGEEFHRKVESVHVNERGEKTSFTQQDRDACDLTDLYATFVCDHATRLTRSGVERELRMLCDELKIGIRDQAISDAMKVWTDDRKRHRLYEIYTDIATNDAGFDADAAWLGMAEAVFDCSDTSPAFVAAVIQKFFWQVKRKMRGWEISNHLMPVILGPQGIGKSTLVRAMLKPVAEVALNVDFKMVTEERNIDIWDSYVMFLDEMGYASKADIDAVKNIITASTLTRRPMNTNARDIVLQKATLIGCSNKEVGQLVKDPTGNRRFAGIRMRANVDRAFVNAIDWATMWRSVDAKGADPMNGFETMLADQQEQDRETSRVEQWMADFDGCSNVWHAKINKAGNIAAKDLFLVFSEYEIENFPSGHKLSKNDWHQEMRRLSNNSPEKVIFTKSISRGQTMYRWKDSPQSFIRLVD